MTFAESMIAAAREELGTPFHHQGRLSKVGLDCAGLCVLAARAAGHEPIDFKGYQRTPLAADMLATLHAQCDSVKLGDVRPGDIVTFKFTGNPQHLAIVTGFNAETGAMRIIHAYQSLGCVVEHDVNATFKAHIFGAFRVKQGS